MDSQDLQGVIIGTSTAVALSPFEDAPMENLLKRAQDLIARGELNEDLLQKVNAAMGMFFWIGWHARGATEDSDNIQRLMEYLQKGIARLGDRTRRLGNMLVVCFSNTALGETLTSTAIVCDDLPVAKPPLFL